MVWTEDRWHSKDRGSISLHSTAEALTIDIEYYGIQDKTLKYSVL